MDDERVEEALSVIDRIYYDGNLNREETLARINEIKDRVDALQEDLL